MTDKERKSKEEIINLRSFYYSNTYQNDQNRSRYMSENVHRDLTPFSDYLKKSLDNARESSKIKAECYEIKERLVLKPKFSLIRINVDKCAYIEKPKDKYYVIDWNDEWGSILDFDAILLGRTVIIEKDAIIDNYAKKVLFKYSGGELDCNEKYSLFMQGSNDSHSCVLRKLSYSKIDDYAIKSGKATIISCNENDGKLVYYYSGELSNKVLLFNSVYQEVLVQASIDIEGMSLKMGNLKLSTYDKNEKLVLVKCDEDELTRLYDGEQEIEYDIVSKEEICSIINDSKHIRYNDKKLEIVDNDFCKEIKEVDIKGLTFEIKSPLKDLRHTCKESIFIELKEDDSFSGDIFSNVSYFFKETTEILTDSPEKGGRRFKIGNKYENYSQLEIWEINKNNKPIGIESLPKYLYIEPNTRQLLMQMNALNILMNKPCIYHAPILELMKDKTNSEWGKVEYNDIAEWYKLTDDKYEGCNTQREFVKKALATPDFAILEGPPGSGKTTTILEIIAQYVNLGKKVMLAASTNAAIDNILERLDCLPDKIKKKILAVRIGNKSAISDSVKGYTIFDFDKEIADEIITRANLVCGTIIGILQHPEFHLSDNKQPAIPLYDCLIIDEASKTTFQEFLVPAIYAKKWVLSGDLKQLTPYVEQDNIESSISQIKGFDVNHQMAQTILMTLEQGVFSKNNDLIRRLKFCVCVSKEVLQAVTDLIDDYPDRRIGLLGDVLHDNAVTKKDFINGSLKSAIVYGSDILFISKDDYHDVEKYLPASHIVILRGENGYSSFLNEAYYNNKINTLVFNNNVKSVKDFRGVLEKEIKEKPWASEIAWRVCRIQELFLLSQLTNSRDLKTDKYNQQIQDRIPKKFKKEINEVISLLQEIALPSIIQLLQQGVKDRDIVRSRKMTTLNNGFEQNVLKDRHSLVEYQHRMHDDISFFSAKYIYGGQALNNGKTIDRTWNFNLYPRRNYWIQVSGKVDKSKNVKEVQTIVEEIKKFIEFAEINPKKDGELWSIACLTYYRAQEKEIKSQIQKLLRLARSTSYYKDIDKNFEIMIYTVDKFQGKEADIVFLSMIKSGENIGVGFMDSPNRLNVALTRAKYQMVVVGDKEYFKSNRCQSELLKKLAEEY